MTTQTTFTWQLIASYLLHWTPMAIAAVIAAGLAVTVWIVTR